MTQQSRPCLKHITIGFGLSALFLVMALWFNIANLMTYIAETTLGWIVALLMWVVNGFVFGWVQMVVSNASVRDDDDEDDHHGGRRLRDMERDHAVVRVPVEKRRGPF